MNTTPTTIDLDPNENILSVAEVTKQIAEAINDRFGSMPIWLKGEVSNYRGRNQRGHMYFSLKDEEALIPAVYFSRQNRALDFELDEGLDVIAQGRINIYAPHGRYQLVVDRLLPGGIGKLHIRFEKLKKKLAEEGLFADERKRPLAEMPRTIAVVTSPTGSVIRDILTIFRQRYPLVKVILFPAQVQGDGAAATIAAAIEQANTISQDNDNSVFIDTMIVARGGGSMEDLWPFNEEVVARAIATSQIPIISAVGHETDFSISDFTADVRAATPTHAAELAVPDCRQLLKELHSSAEHFWNLLTRDYRHANERLQQIKRSSVLRFPEKLVVDRFQKLDGILDQLNRSVDGSLALAKQKQQPLAATLKALNPLKVLNRGFSLTETLAGEVVRQAAQVKAKEQLRVHLHQGQLRCTVNEVE